MGRNFFEKGMKNFSGKEIFGTEMIGRFGGEKNLRHTDVIGRGNVRSMMNVRDFHLGSERNWGGDSNRRPTARSGGTAERGAMEGKRG